MKGDKKIWFGSVEGERGYWKNEEQVFPVSHSFPAEMMKFRESVECFL